MQKLMLLLLALCLLASGVAAAETDADAKVLVVFFSRHGSSVGEDDADATSSASLATGDVAQLTDLVREATGGDLFQIITVDPYPKDYTATTVQATAEQNENARPPLATAIDNMDEYDTILLGYPIWWGTLPMPVMTFLESYDFTGKTILPYCAHGGSGLGRSVEDLKAACPDATVLEGLAVRAGDTATAAAQVTDWLARLDQKEP